MSRREQAHDALSGRPRRAAEETRRRSAGRPAPTVAGGSPRRGRPAAPRRRDGPGVSRRRARPATTAPRRRTSPSLHTQPNHLITDAELSFFGTLFDYSTTYHRLLLVVSRSLTGSGPVPSLFVKSVATRSPQSCSSASFLSSVLSVKSLRTLRYVWYVMCISDMLLMHSCSSS